MAIDGFNIRSLMILCQIEGRQQAIHKDLKKGNGINKSNSH